MTVIDPSSRPFLPEITSPARLDFGCGQAKQPGYIGMDIFPGEGVDVVHDFDRFPYGRGRWFKALPKLLFPPLSAFL